MPIALPPFAPLPSLWPTVSERGPRPRPKRAARPQPAPAQAPVDSRVTLDASHTEFPVLSLVQDHASGEPDRAQPAHGKTAAAVDQARAAEQEQLRQLALACMAGDAGAWQQLVRLQHRRIYGICYRFTGSQTDAEDLTQDVFVKLYRSLGSFDPSKGAFQTWIVTLTRNLLVDHFRRTRQDRATDSLDVTVMEDGEGPTRAEQLADSRTGQFENVARQQMRSRIQNALKQISPELREAVILRDLEDLDYKEVAQVLRVPEGTVKSRISRGRAELARILQREGIARPALAAGAAR
ncbi:RNA polymerase sigma factor [Terriglobus sp.]|uniref:RNA polymerase sigma factor n=1 Tax=Terriglobus sp. TaxID=1889013 RepID=UPI003AFFC60C